MISVAVEIPDLKELVNDEARDIMRLVTISTADRMKTKIADSLPSGKTYRRNAVTRKRRGKKEKDALKSLGFKANDDGYFTVGYEFHRASAPGQPPAVDSSNLLTTIMPKVKDLQGEIFLADYGLYLEFGTDTIAPREFFTPSLEEVLQEI